jgi:hypothetical protein
MYRKKMSRKKSKRQFAKTAMKVNRKNHVKPRRGGYRIYVCNGMLSPTTCL